MTVELITTPVGTYVPGANTVVHNTSANFISMERGEPVHLRQYDQTVPIIAVELYIGQQPYSVPDGAAVNIRMEKPDKKHVYNPAKGVSSDRQTAYFEATAQMTAAFGLSEPIVEIVIADGIAGTASFTIDIAKNPVPEDAYESTDEYKTIQQLAAEVTQAAQIVTENEAAIKTIGENLDTIKQAPIAAENAAASATLSQSWAVGGTGTREGEDADNAKYYALQAQQVSQGAVGWYETEQALQVAHPIGQNGQWAIVGDTDTIWTWDSDTSNWVDTSTKINMSDYYQKEEADARFATAEQGRLAQNAVQSVNGKAGSAVTLAPSDIGAASEGLVLPSVISISSGAIQNKVGQNVNFLGVDVSSANPTVNAPYFFGLNDASGFTNSPVVSGPFWGYVQIFSSPYKNNSPTGTHLTTVLIVESYPTPGKMYGNVYDNSQSKWIGWN